jgi:flagellar basal body-associated protein FliL
MIESILSELGKEYPYVALIALLLIALFRSQIVAILPKTVQGYFSDRAKLRADQQEYQQETERAARELHRMKELADLSASNFVEEQVTQFTAETQVQLNEANSFVRQIVSNKLDMINERLIALRESIQQIKEIQSFILREIKSNEKGGGGGGL